MLSGEELYKRYKKGGSTDISPQFSSEEWVCLYTYLSQQNNEDAFHVLEHAIQDHPHCSPLLIQKVKLDLFDGFFDEAFALLSEELSNAPERDIKPLWIDFYFSTGEDDYAKQLLDNLFAEQPDYIETALEYIIPTRCRGDSSYRICRLYETSRRNISSKPHSPGRMARRIKRRIAYGRGCESV